MKKYWAQRRRKKTRSRKSRRHLHLESLESRQLLAVDAFVVDTAVDENDGVGVGSGTSLREAIIAANADPDLTTISFDPALNGTTINLTLTPTNGPLTVNSTVVVDGNGADNTTIDGNNRHVFSASSDLTINDVTVTGAGGQNAITATSGTLTVNRSTVSGSAFGISGSGNSTVAVTDSTITGNLSGGIRATAYGSGPQTTTINNSTISGNGTGVYVGAGYYGSGANVSISNSTISGNSAAGVFAYEAYYPGGIPVVSIESTIVGDNATDVGRTGSSIINASFSLIESGVGAINGTNVNNITGVDPLLDPAGLQDNGGPTDTIALQPGSPAIDAGSNPLGLVNDQRGAGFPREDGGAANIGAVEAVLAPPDTTPPVLTAFARENPAAENTDAEVLVFRASFDEDVINVDVADFAVESLSTAAVTAIAQVNASTYDVTVSGGDLADFDGVVGLNLAAGQDIADIAGNLLPAGEPAIDETYVLANAPTDPVDVLNGLIAEITQLHNDGVFNSGQEDALLKKVENSLKSLDKEKFGTAINQLKALGNQISAFVNSGILTQAQADGLLEEIDLAIDLIEEL